jgi:hypothetical protein
VSARPDDIRPFLVWYRRDTANGVYNSAVPHPDRHEIGCRVYWGSHGCSRPQGHDGDCWCDCCDCADHPDEDSGCVAGPPYYGADTNFYGEDVSDRGLREGSR